MKIKSIKYQIAALIIIILSIMILSQKNYSVCSAFTADINSNHNHLYQQDEFIKCDCCEKSTLRFYIRGWRKYSDGRNICNVCYSHSISNPEDINKALEKVVKTLDSLGLRLDLNRIEIAGVDKDDLKKHISDYADNLQGYCDSEIKRGFVKNGQREKTIQHTIYVLKGNHSVAIESAIAHELMHSWLYENTKNDHPAIIREGLCNFISFLYLKRLPFKSSADFITILEKNTDPVYGKGFWEIREKYENIPLSELVSYLRNM